MATSATSVEIDYPESDGKPMGETDVHRDWIIRLIDILKYRYLDQQVYVSGDLLVYYEAGNTRKFVVPDVFVVTDSDPGRRRIYKCWEEPKPPQFVIEVTSRASKRADSIKKPRTYAAIGVREYFVYDPTQDYLDPALRGFRLQEGGTYAPIEPDADGWLWSLELDLKCRLNGKDIVLADGRTGQPLLSRWEGERQARESEQRAREEEQRAREEERRLREASEAEVRRLQDELRRLREGK